MILIAPWARKMPEGILHPKDYPFWKEVVEGLKEHEIIQIGIEGEVQLVDDFRKNLSLSALQALVAQCDTWIAVDSFFQHFCWDLGKYGVVLWGQSDPLIFGHPENANLLKDRKYLREKQFWLWTQCEYKQDAFVEPQVVIETVNTLLNKQ